MPRIPAPIRPFFRYFGTKWRQAPRYPQPKYQDLIEPFAGAAGYSIRHYTRDVHLYDTSPFVVGVWRYLIRATEAEILSLPDVPSEGHVDDLALPQEARWLIGFWLNTGTPTPRKSPNRWMREGSCSPGSFWGPVVRARLARQLRCIRHWQIHEAPYHAAPNRPATWFVDPPYQNGELWRQYKSEPLDYGVLGAWARAREGQVIVCDQAGADYLPFTPLGEFKGGAGAGGHRAKTSHEVVWIGGET